MAFDRKKMRQGLKDRHKESHDHRDDSGKFRPIWKEKDKLKLWKCKAEDHVIDILPYECGDFDPTHTKGEICYFLDVWIHRGVGPNEDNVICLSSTYKSSPIAERRGWKCPICEFRAKLKEQGKQKTDLYKKLQPTRRAIYNIYCQDTEKEMEKGVQIWDVAHFLFEKKVAELSLLPKGGGFVLFSDPDEGKSVSFIMKETSYKDENTGKQQNSIEFGAFRFMDRKPIPDDLLEKTKCLDELIIVPKVEDLRAMIMTADTTPPAEAPAPPEKPADNTNKEQDVPDEVVDPPKASEKQAEKSSDEGCPMGGEMGKDYGAWDECASDCHLVEECKAKAPKKEEAPKAPEAPRKGGLRSRLGKA